MSQTCTKCGLNKPPDRFYYIKRSQSHDTRCKGCVAAYLRQRHAKDGGQAASDAYQRKIAEGWTAKPWREKSDKEKRLAYGAVKRYRAKNKERCGAEQRQGLQMRRSQAYKAAWPSILRHYGSQCLRCKTTSRPLCFDHVVPLSDNGPNTLSNGQPLCRACNTAKGATDRSKDYRPDLGAWIVELGALNPWIAEPMPTGRWHLSKEGRSRAKEMKGREGKELVMPEGKGVGTVSMTMANPSQSSQQSSTAALLSSLLSSLSDAPL